VVKCAVCGRRTYVLRSYGTYRMRFCPCCGLVTEPDGAVAGTIGLSQTLQEEVLRECKEYMESKEN
jgi:hypothetical protein